MINQNRKVGVPVKVRRDKSEFVGEFARRYNSEWLPLEGELADARYERLTEEVCGEFWVRR